MSSSVFFVSPFAFNAFCCWAVALASLITAISIFKKRKGDREAISFGFIWLSVGLCFVAIGSYTLILPKINKPIIYAGQIFIGIIFIPLSYYLSYRALERPKLSKAVAILYSFFFAIWVVLVFSVKFPEAIFTDWGVAFATPRLPLIFFQLAFILPQSVVLLYIIFVQIIHWLKKKKITNLNKFFALFSIILLFSAGYFDEKGMTLGWQLLLFRELELLAVLIAYLCYAEKTQDSIN